ncbi:MAG: hypothetical protein HS107_10755 [Thermoflexaceae bacterium]|nr:hypothetical protein [Thermoflexaceae bacterium]
MSVQEREPIDRDRTTFARARVLREIEARRTVRQAAESLQMSYHGARSQIDALKGITGCQDLREMGRWWETNAPLWLAWCAEQAGLAMKEGARKWGD